MYAWGLPVTGAEIWGGVEGGEGGEAVEWVRAHFRGDASNRMDPKLRVCPLTPIFDPFPVAFVSHL